MVATLTLVADTLTPVRAYAALRRAAGDAASFLLESVVGGERWGRFSILGYNPKREVTLPPGAQGLPSLFDGATRGPAVAAGEHPAARFVRSWVGYIAWDLVHGIDKVPGWGPRATTPPARFFGGSTIVVFDGLSHTVTIAAENEADVERARAHLD